ncbi:hypothetical protein MML48_1g02839 [Holotrichia oblita]|uniref:Uncharacterized protein n=2 Tax=Holotrichia oblita TaxID=644536 RepID=A0ACB9TTN0_HOLOL|nr:hypothetical protein MML48_1g11893 [Holotrichia oblita]KAI4470134.1 hypothetical protein MML48_1g02839 [Holotrichia oblita]
MNTNKADHHTRNQICKTRPAYRQGRKLTAVKSYTINNESQHLCIYGVPQINLRSELKSLCSKYGRVLNIHVALDYETEIFTECYHVQYDRIQSARVAKRLLDDHSFYGGILHVCYAPEYESIQETRHKLFQRCKDVLKRLPNHDFSEENIYVNNGKPLHVDSTNIHEEPHVYDEDPLLTDYRKRKYNAIVDKNGSHSLMKKNVIDYNTKEYINEKIETDNTGHVKKITKNLIPSQVLKYKYNVHNSSKKIIFHNKIVPT